MICSKIRLGLYQRASRTLSLQGLYFILFFCGGRCFIQFPLAKKKNYAKHVKINLMSTMMLH